MSFEETLVCDGCSEVKSGGPRRETVPELLAHGGAAFWLIDRRRGLWAICHPDTAAATSQRHLCGRCNGSVEFFYDGSPVPSGEED